MKFAKLAVKSCLQVALLSPNLCQSSCPCLDGSCPTALSKSCLQYDTVGQTPQHALSLLYSKVHVSTDSHAVIDCRVSSRVPCRDCPIETLEGRTAWEEAQVKRQGDDSIRH